MQKLSFPIGSLVELNEHGVQEHPALARYNPTGLFLITECSVMEGALAYGLDNKHWWFNHYELTLMAEPTEQSLEQVFAILESEDSGIPDDVDDTADIDDEFDQPGGPVGDEEN